MSNYTLPEPDTVNYISQSGIKYPLYLGKRLQAAFAAGQQDGLRTAHDLALLNGSNAPTQPEWDMAQSIARAIRHKMPSKNETGPV